MNTTITLAQMRARDGRLRVDEAIAIAQQLLCGAVESTDAHPPFGPLSDDTVAIGADGRVYCCASAATPAVSEVAILLQELLGDHGSAVPGGLRYSLGRALLEVEAPPFDSLEDFSNVLCRFERGDRTATLAALYARVLRGAAEDPHPHEPALYGGVERRRCMPSSAELRRQLRETDRRLYEVSRSAATAPMSGRSHRRRRAPFAAGVVACSALMAAGGLAYTTHVTAIAPQLASPQPDDQPAPLAATRFDRAEVPLPVDGPVMTMTNRSRSAGPAPLRARTTAHHNRTTFPRTRRDVAIAPRLRFEWDNRFRRTH